MPLVEVQSCRHSEVSISNLSFIVIRSSMEVLNGLL